MNGDFNPESIDLGAEFDKFLEAAHGYLEHDEFPEFLFDDEEQEAMGEHTVLPEVFEQHAKEFVEDVVMQLAIGMDTMHGVHFYDVIFATVFQYVFPLYMRGVLLGIDAATDETIVATFHDHEDVLRDMRNFYANATVTVTGTEEYNPFD